MAESPLDNQWPEPHQQRLPYWRIRRYGVTVPGGATVDSETFTYDEAGNLKTAQNAAYTTTIGYDVAGRLQDVGEAGLTTHYTYLNGQLSARTDPAGATAFTYRSGDGLVNSVIDPLAAGVPTVYGYDTWGRQVSRTDPGQIITARVYDVSGRLESQATRKGTNGPSFSVSRAYDEASNVVNEQRHASGRTDDGLWWFAYDPINRMTESHPPSGSSTTYAFDKAGNRTDTWTGTTHVSTAYDGANRPTSSSDGTVYAVDAIGELTNIVGSARTWNITYDTWGRQVATWGAGGSPSFSYAFDALDRMVARVQSGLLGNTITYGYVGLSEDLAATGGSQVTQIAQGPGGPLAQRSGLLTTSLALNLHGDVVGAMERTTGLPVGQKAYGPYGEPLGTGTLTSPIGYQGDLTDASTGFVDMGTRNLDPLLGRFTSRDVLFGEPTRPASLNQFLYAEDAPATHTDPTGMGVSCGGFGGAGSDCTNKEVAKGPGGGGLGQGDNSDGNGYGQTGSYLALGQWAQRRLRAVMSLLMEQIRRQLGSHWTHEYFNHFGSNWISGYHQNPWSAYAPLAIAGLAAATIGVCVITAATQCTTAIGGASRAAEEIIEKGSNARFAVDSAGAVTAYVRNASEVFELSEHATLRMAQRGVSIQAVEDAISSSSLQFDYVHQGLLKTGYYDVGSRLFVATYAGEVRTVIVDASWAYINNLRGS